MVDVVSKVDTDEFFSEINRLSSQYHNPNTTRRQIINRILRSGALIIRDEAKSQAPVRTGHLKRSIRVRQKRQRRGATPGVLVNHRTKNNPRVSFQQVLAVNYGLTGTRRYRPARAGNPYLIRAARTKEGEVRNRVIRGFRQDIDEYIRRRARSRSRPRR